MRAMISSKIHLRMTCLRYAWKTSLGRLLSVVPLNRDCFSSQRFNVSSNYVLKLVSLSVFNVQIC